MGLLDFFKGKKVSTTDSSVTRNNWNFYFHAQNQQFASVAYDVRAAEEENHLGYSHGRRLTVQLTKEQTEENGMPTKAEFARLGQLEDELTSFLQRERIVCLLVGRVTGFSLRDFVFQVEDAKSFDRIVEAWMKKQTTRHVKLEKNEGWTFFDQMIRPTSMDSQQIKDRSVLESLKQAGSNLRKPHMLEHGFFGAEDKLQALADRLTKDGFVVGQKGDQFLMVQKESEMNLWTVWDTTCGLISVAKEYGVDYDGWGAGVVKLI